MTLGPDGGGGGASRFEKSSKSNSSNVKSSAISSSSEGTGIEGLVNAAKDRFSNVQRFSPTASRSSSSETYLVCQKRLSRVRAAARGKTALEQVNEHLGELGVVVDEADEDEETVVGFRRLSKDE